MSNIKDAAKYGFVLRVWANVQKAASDPDLTFGELKMMLTHYSGQAFGYSMAFTGEPELLKYCWNMDQKINEIIRERAETQS